MTSEYSYAFTFNGFPLPEVVPWWWAPPPESSAYAIRTLLHSDWFLPILITILNFYVLWFIQEIALTLFLSSLYIDVEKLPFPIARINAEMCITLAQRDPEKIRMFTLSSIVGLVYGIILYAVPMLTFGLFGVLLTPIPIPWIDLTAGYYGIENMLPGAGLGIATDLVAFLGGFLIPFSNIVYMFIGSISVWIFGNWFTRAYMGSTFPEWTQEWYRGSSLMLIYQRAFLRVWIGPLISFALAAAVISIIKGYRSIIRAFTGLGRVYGIAGRKRSFYPIILYLAGNISSIILLHLLMPDFPIWVLIMVFTAGGFLQAIIAARGMAETGYTVSLPYLWEGSILLSGYKGIEPWFGPWMGMGTSADITGTGSAIYTNSMKVAYLTGTKPMDFIKAKIIGIITYIIFSFVYVQFFWALAPIPSVVYPYTQVTWPVNVMSIGMWASGQITSFKPMVMLSSFMIMSFVGVLGELLNRFVGIPFSLVSIVVGCSAPPTASISLLIGGLIGNYAFQKYFGKDWWMRNRAVIAAGAMCGEGIAVGIATATTLIIKSVWLLPW